jgi:hypothetical protein
MTDDQFARCSDGHLFTTNLARQLFAVHLVNRSFQRCPIDHKWRMVEKLRKNDLTDAEVTRARAGKG